MTSRCGKVYLVGAGPGDPGLLTLRGAECLRAADVVLYDYLASPELLIGLGPNVELVCLGKHGHGRLLSQAEINERMVREALQGKAVVRLKGGDPSIFARLSDELAALEAAGVPYEIVPGITAAQAASSHAGIPLTNRDDASCVAFVTGQESCDKEASGELDYAALATFPGTLVFYMGVTTAPEWSRCAHRTRQIAANAGRDRPALLAADQQTIFTTLAEVGDHLGQGETAAAGDRDRRRRGCGEHKPKLVYLATAVRPDGACDAARTTNRVDGVAAASARARMCCISRRSKSASRATGRRWMSRLSGSKISIGSCSRAATACTIFCKRLFALGLDLRALGGVRLAAIGPATVAALAEYHLTADVQPESYRAEALAEALAPEAARPAFPARPRQPRSRSACRNACQAAADSHASRRLRKQRRRDARRRSAGRPARRPDRLDDRHKFRHRPLAGQRCLAKICGTRD